jgi:hypothetical protein
MHAVPLVINDPGGPALLSLELLSLFLKPGEHHFGPPLIVLLLIHDFLHDAGVFGAVWELLDAAGDVPHVLKPVGHRLLVLEELRQLGLPH